MKYIFFWEDLTVYAPCRMVRAVYAGQFTSKKAMLVTLVQNFRRQGILLREAGSPKLLSSPKIATEFWRWYLYLRRRFKNTQFIEVGLWKSRAYSGADLSRGPSLPSPIWWLHIEEPLRVLQMPPPPRTSLPQPGLPAPPLTTRLPPLSSLCVSPVIWSLSFPITSPVVSLQLRLSLSKSLDLEWWPWDLLCRARDLVRCRWVGSVAAQGDRGGWLLVVCEQGGCRRI